MNDRNALADLFPSQPKRYRFRAACDTCGRRRVLRDYQRGGIEADLCRQCYADQLRADDADEAREATP